MSWDASVAAAEIVGAFGVIFTLAYLAYQIGQTNRIARSSVVTDLQQKYNEFLAIVLTSTEVSELAAQLTDPTYTPKSEVDRQRIDNFANLLTSIWFSAQGSYDQGQIDKTLCDIYCTDVLVKIKKWPAIKQPVKEFMAQYPGGKDLEIFAPFYATED